MKDFRFVLVLVTLISPVSAKAARLPADGVLGLRLGMSKTEAIERLEKMGEATAEQGEEAATRQRWLLSDSSYTHVVVNYDPKQRVHWISAFARPGGRVVRYRDIGDLKQARKKGSYIYTWSVPARGKREPYQVIARGTGPDTLQSLSFVRVRRAAK